MSKMPQKKGKLAQDEDGDTVLVNENGDIFEADSIVIAIWNSFDGDLSVDKMASDIGEESGEDEEAIKEGIEDILDKLEEADLVKL